jgi:hypothetical protein
VASLLLGVFLIPKEKNKLTISSTPLTTEEMEVYGIFLDSFVGKGKVPVNFSDKTFPFTLLDTDKQGPCLEGIKLNNSAEASQTIHAFEPSISIGRAIRLVDERKHKIKDPGKAIKNGESVASAVSAGFQSGLLRVSEIVFDEAHHFAVLRFSFYCGSMCGHGGALVFEKVYGKWKESNRSCPFWQS